MKIPFLVWPTTACLVTTALFWPAVSWFSGAATLNPAPLAAAASPAHAPTPTFTTISVPTVKFTAPAMEEIPPAASAKLERFERGDFDLPPETTPAPVRASVVRPSRACDKYVRPIAIPKRESLLDDREAKLEAALVSSNRNSIAYSKCKRREQAPPGG